MIGLALQQGDAQLVVSVLGIAIYAFIAVSGLALVNGHRRAEALVQWAIALQIPWVSSPVLTYHLDSGTGLSIFVLGGRVEWSILWVGSQWEFRFLQERPWGVGINLVAIALMFLLWQSRCTVLVVATSQDDAGNANLGPTSKT
jgi:hypothetical protein